MNITTEQVLAAQAAGIEVRSIINGEEYELGAFFVPHRKGADGKYHILKHEPWYVTDAYVVICNTWAEQVQGFDGWVQAIRYLKENIGDLI